MSEKPINPLRQRMLDDMNIRRFTPDTQRDYIRSVKKLAAFLGRSPDTATAEDLRAFQLHLTEAGVQPPTINATVTVLRFFFSFNHAFNVDPDPRLSEWLGFVLMLPVAFGISFQLPLVMLFLERIGIFTAASYVSKWRIAVLSIAVAAGCAAAGGSPSFSVCVRIGTGSCAAGNWREAGPVSTGFSGPSSTQGISHTAIATSTAAPTSRSFKPWSM